MAVAAKKQLSPLHQVLGGEHGLEVVPGRHSGLPLVVVAGPQPALDLAAHALEGGGRDHPLGRAADAVEDVDARVGPGGRDGTGHVAVGDQLDAGAAARAPLR